MARGALEADAAITLAVGDGCRDPSPRVVCSGAGVDSGVASFFNVRRKAEGAHHIAIRLALLVHATDISLPDGAEEVVLETDAVAFQHITLAIRDTVIDEAAGLGAERVLLVLAYHERSVRIEHRLVLETESSDRGDQLDGCDCGYKSKNPIHDSHVRPLFCLVVRLSLSSGLPVITRTATNDFVCHLHLHHSAPEIPRSRARDLMPIFFLVLRDRKWERTLPLSKHIY